MSFDFAHHFDAWLKSWLGRELLMAERKMAWSFVQPLTNPKWLQIGGPTELFYKENQDPRYQYLINKRIYVFDELVTTQLGGGSQVVAETDALPFAPQAFDSILLWHILETAKDPKSCLREAEQTLSEEGLLIILAFNPFSLFGLRHLIQKYWHKIYKHKPKLQIRYISSLRIRWWLHKLGLQVVFERRLFFRPPINSAKWLQRLLFMETFGAMFVNDLGNVNLLVARKKVAGVSPLVDVKELFNANFKPGVRVLNSQRSPDQVGG